MALTYDPLNPIRRVGSTQNNMAVPIWMDGSVEKLIRAPASYLYKLEDVSAADSGRTEDTMMYKNRVGQLVGIELSWTYLPTAEASALLNIFDPEYIYVEYLDLKRGAWRTASFYVGNRSAPYYNATKGLWTNLSFNLIERDGRNYLN